MAITLVVENGTGLANANAYVDVAYVDVYAESMNNDVWNLNPSLKEIAIINATRFIDQKYGRRFVSSILVNTQALLWPRIEYKDYHGRTITGVPVQLKDATAQAALDYLANNGLTLAEPVENAIQSTSVNIGGAVQESVTYFYPTNNSEYVQLDYLLRDLVYNNSNIINLVRG